MRTCSNCYCLLITTGAMCIGELLKENCTLKVLYMNDNPVGDAGISQLMDRLCLNTTLTELSVENCEISAKGTTCNSCNTGGSGLPDMYTLTLGPHVYMSDKTQPHAMADPGWGIWGKCPPPPPSPSCGGTSHASD